ncbi:unnamed protein product [Cyclocybe aegerita]|uniref:Uncharacterized protein n=1 Tax=Cyclocybe aegerita TaxID=1973307 RepID=A0A8S0W593_CYCAE|nr:unnamed protein product [Cyclocybe aegerita]
MQNARVAVLTRPSSAKSASFSLDSPEVSSALALVRKSGAIVPSSRSTGEQPKTFTFTEADLTAFAQKILNDAKASARAETAAQAAAKAEDSDSDSDSDSSGTIPRKQASTRAKAKASGGSYSNNRRNVGSFNNIGGAPPVSKKSRTGSNKGSDGSNNDDNYGSFNFSTGETAPGARMPWEVPYKFHKSSSGKGGKKSKKCGSSNLFIGVRVSKLISITFLAQD